MDFRMFDGHWRWRRFRSTTGCAEEDLALEHAAQAERVRGWAAGLLGRGDPRSGFTASWVVVTRYGWAAPLRGELSQINARGGEEVPRNLRHCPASTVPPPRAGS